MLARTGEAKPLPHPANTNQSPPAAAPILLAPWQTRAELEPGGGSGSHGRDNIPEPGHVYGERGKHGVAFNCSTAREKGIFCRHLCSSYWQPSSWEFVK